jgi:hypothetical protein
MYNPMEYIRYVLVFFIVFFRSFLYSPPLIHVYIRSFDPRMNTSDIHNTSRHIMMLHEASDPSDRHSLFAY